MQFKDGTLNLLRKDDTLATFNAITFVDQVLPFAQYLPAQNKFPHLIDMIIGGELAWN